MKFTVLQLTQQILSALNSDQVNSIGDTAESLQIASILEQTFYNITSRSDLPEQYGLFQLEASLDPTIPIMLTKPANVAKVHWIKYFDTNPNDGGTLQTDQFGAYSTPHDTNTDLSFNGSAAFSGPWTFTSASTITLTAGTQVQSFNVVTQGVNVAIGQTVLIYEGTNTLVASGTVQAYFTTPTPFSITYLVVNIENVGPAFVGVPISSWTLTQGSTIGQAPGYCYVRILPITPFIDMVNKFNLGSSDVYTYTFSGNTVTGEPNEQFTFYYKNDHQPSYCTCIENQFFLFDTFDATQDSTLQASKTMCYGEMIPQFLLEDDFIPNIDDYNFQLLLAEAKELAFLELKQMEHPKAAQETRRQWSRLQKDKSVTNKPTYFNQLPSFGRMPNTGGYGAWGYDSPGQGPGNTWNRYL